MIMMIHFRTVSKSVSPDYTSLLHFPGVTCYNQKLNLSTTKSYILKAKKVSETTTKPLVGNVGKSGKQNFVEKNCVNHKNLMNFATKQHICLSRFGKQNWSNFFFFLKWFNWCYYQCSLLLVFRYDNIHQLFHAINSICVFRCTRMICQNCT